MDSGSLAWVLVSAALVLFMTPGLAFFYGGMDRGRNVLNMLMMNFYCVLIVPVLWMGLQMGVFTGGLAWLGPLPLGFAAPLTWTVVEFLFPTLFPWRIAHTQYRVVPLLQSGERGAPGVGRHTHHLGPWSRAQHAIITSSETGEARRRT